MARPSRDMLTTGLVGGYMLASAWLVLFIVAVSALLLQEESHAFLRLGFMLGLVVGLCGLVWIGGAICEGIGWIGLNRLHGGLPAVIGWIFVMLPGVALLTFLGTAAGGEEAGLVLVHVFLVLALAYHVLALVFYAGRSPRRFTVPALVGHTLAVAGGGGLYVMLLVEHDPEVLGYVLLLMGLAGMTVAHFANGLYLGQSRIIADSVNTFL